MRRSAAVALLVAGLVPVTGPRISAAPAVLQAPASTPTPRAFVDEYCVACHNARARVAGVSLADPAIDDITANAELWEKVLHKLDTGQMPPAGRPQPPLAVSHAVAATVATTLDAHAAAHPVPGRVGVHRLNRTEYQNAIRDLLALDIDAKAMLLPDEADEGFDNVAASLALSPVHLERYLSAARDISRLAVSDASLGALPASHVYKVPKLLEQDVRTSEALPFGARGGIVVEHTFPLDGEYLFKIRLRRQVYDYIIGMGTAQTLDVRLDGRRVRRFTVGGEATGTPGPLTWNGEIVGETAWELYMHAADDGLEVRVPVTAGPHVVTAAFVDTPWVPERIEQPPPVDFGRGSDERYDGLAAVDSLAVQGPYDATGAGDTPSRRAIFVCTPKTAADEAPCARRILATLARRAYRRPVTDDDLAVLLDFYRRARATRGFEGGIQSAVERMLVSFNFLFRIEHDPQGVPAGTAHRLSDVELASRLSFFLWSSIPDDRLLTVAEQGRLSRPEVLEAEVRRMLADPRASSLVESFASQWLGLRKAANWSPDPNAFPEFDENLRRAFIRETTLFIESQFRDDRSVVDLLDADYSFVNARLARHYGLDGAFGQRFERVRFTDGRRGGLLGQGGLLMVTSYPDRTTPVLRGTWVLENLLGMPPPPPPPNVPSLEATAPDGRLRSIREQMEVHRRNPACAVCHVRMDPLGFALENFDAVGRWRDQSGGIPVDASAVFADGTPIDGVTGLRAFLLAHRETYVHAFVEKLLTYALGRRVDYHDQPAIRAIVRDADGHDDRWSAIILGIVRSTPFQMRTAS
ncbi:MAG: DUF1592 domain-containing protein [Vicinamibacterales bacterium]